LLPVDRLYDEGWVYSGHLKVQPISEIINIINIIINIYILH